MSAGPYDETRMRELIGFYEQLLAGLKDWVAKGGTLRGIQDAQSAPALFQLHQVARAVFPAETGLELAPAEKASVQAQTVSANAILKAAGVSFELREGELVALSAIMRTHAFIDLAPYKPAGADNKLLVW